MYGSYWRMDFLVKHLIGKNPPQEYKLEVFPMEKLGEFDVPPMIQLSLQLDL